MNCKRCGNELLVGDQNCKICGDLSNVQNNYYQSQNNNIVYNQCKLTLIRKKSIVGSFITFNVYIDKVKVGKIKNGQTLELNIAMGQHKISINKKNEIDIIVNGNTEAELALIGVDNFGLINIDKQNLQFVDNKTCINYIEKNKKSTNSIFAISIIFPIISIFTYYTIGFVIGSLVYAIVIGYAILNIAGIKNQQNIDSNMSKKLMLKNVIAILLLICEFLVTVYITSKY